MAKEFDIVQMKDGRIGTIIDILNEEAFILDITDKAGRTIDWPIVLFSDIERVLYPYQKT